MLLRSVLVFKKLLLLSLLNNQKINIVKHKMESDLVCRASQHHSHVIHHILHHNEGLRHAKAPEGRVGGHVGPAGGSMTQQVGDVVAVVHMKQNLFCYLQEEGKQ